MKADLHTLKDAHWQMYLELNSRPLPQMWPAPSVEEAYRLGLKRGYREGLLTGVVLGVELLASGASLASASRPFDVS